MKMIKLFKHENDKATDRKDSTQPATIIKANLRIFKAPPITMFHIQKLKGIMIQR